MKIKSHKQKRTENLTCIRCISAISNYIVSHHQVKDFIGSQFADPRKVHAGLAKNNRFSLWIDTERLKTTNQNDESLGMVCPLIHYL